MVLLSSGTIESRSVRALNPKHNTAAAVSSSCPRDGGRCTLRTQMWPHVHTPNYYTVLYTVRGFNWCSEQCTYHANSQQCISQSCKQAFTSKHIIHRPPPHSRGSPVNQLAAHATLEEPRAAVARQNAVVLAGAGVAAYHTNQAHVLQFLVARRRSGGRIRHRHGHLLTGRIGGRARCGRSGRCT